MALIISNEKIASGIYKIKIKGTFKGEAGQFYMIKPENTFLSRPISIHDIDSEGITFVYQVKGEGTKFFSHLKEGMEISLFGPCGSGFSLSELKADSFGIIGGGIGVAPLYYLAKEYKKTYKDAKIKIYLGFKEEEYLVKEFKELGEVILNIGGIITKEVDYENIEIFATCGPTVMMKSAYDFAKNYNKEMIVSLESKMACGMKACLGCNIETTNGNKKVCKDGPVFLGSEVF